MISYSFDGTLDGMFACVFESFTYNEIPYLVTSGTIQTAFGSDTKNIVCSDEKTRRIKTAIIKYSGTKGLNDIVYAMRSGDSAKENVIFFYIRKTFECRKNIGENFSEKAVLDFYDLSQRISYETHRMKGFLRFAETKDGVFFAEFEPDNDITDLVLPHFVARYKNMPFAIHDIKRNVLALWNGSESKVIRPEIRFSVCFSEQENNFQNLWCTYYDSVNIKQRKNLRLMRGWMPTRYYVHMPEKTKARVTSAPPTDSENNARNALTDK